jgi:type I restriction enzyme S subunit
MGQQGTQANLNKGMVWAFQIRLGTLHEQTAIATVLSDMDAELSALEFRREKTQALKQGMMQELLTGRIRLV